MKTTNKKNEMSYYGFFLSLLALAMFVLIFIFNDIGLYLLIGSIIVSILGIVFSSIGIGFSKEHNKSGFVLSVVGLAFNILVLILDIIFLVLVLIIIISMINAGTTN